MLRRVRRKIESSALSPAQKHNGNVIQVHGNDHIHRHRPKSLDVVKDAETHYPRQGSNYTGISRAKPYSSPTAGAESGAVGPETDELARLLASLTPAQRKALLAMAREGK